jgi:hypothetical protein
VGGQLGNNCGVLVVGGRKPLFYKNYANMDVCIIFIPYKKQPKVVFCSPPFELVNN